MSMNPFKKEKVTLKSMILQTCVLFGMGCILTVATFLAFSGAININPSNSYTLAVMNIMFPVLTIASFASSIITYQRIKKYFPDELELEISDEEAPKIVEEKTK